ncbi:MAG: Rne/Rng family ribonuclease [Desulforhopalus sp.]
MAEKKTVDKEKKTVQIKATTGAWWKSTSNVPDTDSLPDENAKPAIPEVSETKQEIASSEEQPKKKKAPARKPRKKPLVTVSLEKTDPEADAPAQDESKKSVPKRAPSKKPPTRRNTGKSKETRDEKIPAEAVPTETTELIIGVDADVLTVEEHPPEEKVPSKRSRGRRGRGTGKKKIEKIVIEEISSETQETRQGTDSAAASIATDEEVVDYIDYSSIESEENELPKVSQTRPVKEKPAKVAEPKEEVKKVCKLLINAEEPEECRLALLEDGRLESIHVSTISRTQTKNNIYKARIVAIEPSLQAAFVDYGTEKNGFLPFSEIHPEYYKPELSAEIRHQADNNQWKKISITDVVEKGQEILAQVVKEEVGKKGANMTTFLSIPGRCVVLMPGSDSSGISRKISGEQRRSQLRDTMASMNLPEGIGWIVRTASVDITQEALARDVEYLLELWGEIKTKGQEMEGVGLVYEDQKSVLRFLREHFDPSIQEILVDDRTALEQVKEFVKMLPSQQRNVNVRFHQGARPIFNQYSIEDQIESIYQPQVNLPSGGSIVIDPTEALVAVDVNSGSTSRGKNFEASIFQANIEAATELARQLRLRDLGGLIVVDFIDMRNKKHILAVEREMKVAMKKDKAKVDFSRISKFGLMQISRQKLGAPIESGNYRRCEHCKGRGTVRSVETLSLYYLRRIQTGASRKAVENIECHFPLDVASYLLNNKRSEFSELEKRYQVEITIIAEVDMKPADNEILFHKVEKEIISKKQA